MDNVIESQFIELTRPHNIIVGVIYRPPNNNLELFKESLLQLLQNLGSQKKKCFLMGDINSDLLKAEENRHTNDILNYMLSSSFYPLISRPTRITSTSATLIDNIFINSLEDNFTCGLLLTDISDHLPIFQITTTITNANTIPIKETKHRKITSETLALLNQKLKCENWEDVYREENPQYAYTTFYKILYNAFDQTVPLMKQKIRHKKSYQTPWITKEILDARKFKNKLYKRFIKNPNDANENNYKTCRNKFNNMKRIAKKSYYKSKFQESQGNIRQTWKLINEITNKNKPSSELPDNFMKDDNIITDPNEIANNFNDYFVNAGPKLADKIPPSNVNFSSYLPASNQDSIFLDPITENEVKIEIDQLNVNKSGGYDEMSPTVIKAISNIVVKPLTYIYNQTFLTGVIPNEFKMAIVTPVFKSNDKESFSNYRPISVLPCFSKILEKLMYKRIIKFIDKHNTLNEHQYGFRKKHSTNHAILELVTKITKAIDSNQYTMGVFLDLSKAFDTVNHAVLLYKLEHYGIRGIVLEWFKNYLQFRKQVVKYKITKSDSLTISCGVPQGSVLGPLLFLIYINDISRCSQLLSFILFADDTNLFLSHHDIETLIRIMNEELEKVALWLTANKLSLNVNKTHLMIFKTRKKRLSHNAHVVLNGSPIEKVKYTKFLGIFIDEELSWKYHINHISAKVSKMVGIMAKARHHLSLKLLLTLYNTMIYPYLTYCNVIWANTYSTRLRSIFMLQKKIVRIITFSNYTEESRPLFKSLKILDIYELNTYLTGIFMYWYYHGNLPAYFINFFVQNESIHSYGTRSATKIHIEFKRTNYAKFSLKYKGATMWNSLPDDIKNIDSFNRFKKGLKLYIQNQPCNEE